MQLVDAGGRGTEAVPYLLTELLGHGAIFLPLLMQLLKLGEGLHYVGTLLQSLGLLAESGLDLKILLEIQVAEFIVYLNIVIEFLNIVLIRVVDILNTGLGHRTGLAPAGLEVAELRIGAVQVPGVIHQVLEFLYDLQLAVQVGLLLSFQILEIDCAAALIAGIQFLERTLDLDKWIHGDFRRGILLHRLLHCLRFLSCFHRTVSGNCPGFFLFRKSGIVGSSWLHMVAGCYLLLFQHLIECSLDILGLPVEFHDITVVHQVTESLDYLLEALGREALQLLVADNGSAHLLRLLYGRFLRHRLLRCGRLLIVSSVHNLPGSHHCGGHSSGLLDSGTHFRSINIQ